MLAMIKVKLVINLDSATWNKESKRNLTVGKLYEDTLCFHIMACGSVIQNVQGGPRETDGL